MAHLQEEWNALVDGISRLPPAKGVSVPHGKRLACAIKRPGLVSETEVVVIGCSPFADGEPGSLPLHRCGILLQHIAGKVRHGKTKLLIEPDAQLFGRKPLRLGDNPDAAGSGGGNDGPGSIFRDSAALTNANTKNIVT